MLDIYVAPSLKAISREGPPVRLSLGGPIYVFLRRYFVQACLPPGSLKFLDEYSDTEVSGYQLVRLRQVLIEALSDLSARPDSFPVLMGWRTADMKEETEMWAQVDREQVKKTATDLIALIDEARAKGMRLVAIGD